MLEIDILLNLSIKDCMFVTSTIEYSEGCSTTKFVVIGHIHKLEKAWLVMLVCHLHHSLLSSSFKSKPKDHYLNHNVLYINDFLLYQVHKFFNFHFITSKIQRGNDTCQFICCVFHSQFLTFIIHGKINIPICSSKLGHPLIVLCNLGIRLSPHLRACLRVKYYL